MHTKWLATTAVLAVLGSGAVWAQAQMPQVPPRGEGADAAGPKAGAGREPTARQDTRQQAPAARQAEPKGGDRDAPSRQAQDGRPSKDGAPQTRKQPENATSGESERRTGESKSGESKSGERKSDGKRNAAGAATDTQEESRHGSQSRESKGKRETEARDRERSGDRNAEGRGDRNAERSRDRNAAEQKRNAESAKPDRKDEPTSAGAVTQQGEAGTRAAEDRRNTAQGSGNPSARDRSARESTRITETERTRIFSTLERRGASRHDINIEINLGQRLPPRVRLRPLPPTIVRIVPEYRGYDYVMVRDEIVIVRPRTREVVDVIHKSGPAQARVETRGGGARVTFTAEQKRVLIRDAREFATAQVSGSGPTCLSYREIPSSLVSDSPELRSYRYIAIGEEIVLFDPDEKRIVEVIR